MQGLRRPSLLRDVSEQADAKKHRATFCQWKLIQTPNKYNVMCCYQRILTTAQRSLRAHSLVNSAHDGAHAFLRPTQQLGFHLVQLDVRPALPASPSSFIAAA